MSAEETVTQVTEVIESLLKAMGTPGTVEYEDSIIKGPLFNISSQDSRMLIGRDGATLHALQQLAQAIVSRKLADGHAFRFSIDVDDYKRKREWEMKEVAKAAAEHVQKTGRAVQLKPMPNYERRYVHAYLGESFPSLFTESVGREPNRRITIRPK